MVLTNKMGGLEPQIEYHFIGRFFKFTRRYFRFFGISSFFLAPTDFTDFTGDLRLVALVAKDFLSNLG